MFLYLDRTWFQSFNNDNKLISLAAGFHLLELNSGSILLNEFTFLQVGKDYVILSSDKHANFIRNQRKDPADFRPDILHQVSI